MKLTAMCISQCAAVVVFAIALMFSSGTQAQSTSPVSEPGRPISLPTLPPTCCEREKLDIEREKIVIEHEKLKQQRESNFLTGMALVLSALVGLGTIAYNIRNANKQARLQAKLKAIEVVMSAAGPGSAKQRLEIVNDILGGEVRLNLNPADLELAGIGAGHDQNRRELLKMLADHPDNQKSILEQWAVIFGSTNLIKNIADLQSLSNEPRG